MEPGVACKEEEQEGPSVWVLPKDELRDGGEGEELDEEVNEEDGDSLGSETDGEEEEEEDDEEDWGDIVEEEPEHVRAETARELTRLMMEDWSGWKEATDAIEARERECGERD